jgi:hypothetical protein
MIIRTLGPEVDIATVANNVANATLIRVVNGGTAGLLTVQFSNGATCGTLTMPGNTVEIVQKKQNHMVIGTGMKASPIAFKG